MRKPSSTTRDITAPDWPTYLGISFIFPLLALYALYLAGDSLTQLNFFSTPDFWSQNLFKANFVCYGPALLTISVLGNVKLYRPDLALNAFGQRVVACIAWCTLALLLVVNTLMLVLHFSFFSPDRYVRCWEPFPWGTWYYARTANICEQHGLAPVRSLNSRSSAESAGAP